MKGFILILYVTFGLGLNGFGSSISNIPFQIELDDSTSIYGDTKLPNSLVADLYKQKNIFVKVNKRTYLLENPQVETPTSISGNLIKSEKSKIDSANTTIYIDQYDIIEGNKVRIKGDQIEHVSTRSSNKNDQRDINKPKRSKKKLRRLGWLFLGLGLSLPAIGFLVALIGWGATVTNVLGIFLIVAGLLFLIVSLGTFSEAKKAE